jgi:hypothetical protein
VLSAGILMAARKVVKLKEKWPIDLERITTKKKSQAKRCMLHVLEVYDETFGKKASSDQQQL